MGFKTEKNKTFLRIYGIEGDCGGREAASRASPNQNVAGSPSSAVVALGVEIQTASQTDSAFARNRYRKSWRLKNGMFTLETDSPRPAPPQLS